MWTAPILAIPCFIVLRWDWCLQKATKTNEQVLVPAHYILTRMCIVCAVVAQLPLLLIIDCATR